MDQLLLQPVRRLDVDERYRASVGHTDGCPMEVAEIPPGCRRGSPSCGARNSEPGSTQRPAVLDKILGRHLNGAPATGSAGSRMRALAWAECNHFARPRFDPAPDGRRSSADRQRDQHHTGGDRDKGDPRQFLFARRQAQAVQHNLGQSRSELAVTGDQEPDNALLAHGSLKIIRFTKYRREGARHFSSPQSPGTGRDRRQTRVEKPTGPLDIYQDCMGGALAIQFRQKIRR